MTVMIRIRPTHSLLDIDVPKIERSLVRVVGRGQVKVIDDRAGDAVFATAVLMVDDFTDSLLAQLREALSRIPRTLATVVDDKGNETPIGSVSAKWVRQIGGKINQ